MWKERFLSVARLTGTCPVWVLTEQMKNGKCFQWQISLERAGILPLIMGIKM